MAKPSIFFHALGAVAIWFCCLAPQASAGALALDFSTAGSTFNCVNPGSGCTAGWGFHVNSTIGVVALGVFENNSSLADTHPVGLWTSGGTLLASATVTSASTPVASAFAGGQWLFTSIAPITLSTGDYVIGEFFNNGSADLTRGMVTASTIPQITFSNAETAGGASLTMPSGAFSADNAGFFGPNFEQSPEPGGALLLATGMGALVLYRRRRKTTGI